MLYIPETCPTTIKIAGTDPGTDTLGCGILEIDIRSLEIVHASAQTFKAARMVRDDWQSDWHSERFARLKWHEDNLLNVFWANQVFMVASESPFFNRLHPSAFGPLMETMCCIKQALYRYDPWKTLYEYDPPSVKNAIGAKGNADKLAVRDALLAYPDLPFSGPVKLEDLDEHSRDALAVAICHLNRLRKG